MILRICKHCGKNINYSENEQKVINIDLCPSCKKPLEDSFTKQFTEDEERLENIRIRKIIEQRELEDDGVVYTLKEIIKKRIDTKNR